MFMLVLFSMGVIGWVWYLIVTAVRWIVLVALVVGFIWLAYKLLTEKRGRP